ncbi:sugar ABC transporter substrate-binding protein [Paraliobacillus sp. X-1268]|uniref:sugar ABC transporter substrate-binding protein n=1 Tax=Paraliobacillus sp. X-1268 TaxID=2213193 RepID=UPI000E3ED43B|nr:substrate-binding domain-containing protein [Paraliobacillus sp. X-1268]
MKINATLILTILFTFYLTACNSNQTTDSQSTDTTDKLLSNPDDIYIGFVMDTLRDDRWYRDKLNFEEKVEELGGIVKTLAANGDQEVQIEQAKLLIKEGVDVLVVIPTNSNEAGEIVELAHEAGVKVISYDKLILDAPVDYYVSFDNVKVGELQAEAILNEVDEGDFAYVGGAETDNNAILFREGAMNILQPYIDSGDINLVYDTYTPEWSPETARDQFASLLSNTNVDAVIAANDGTAGGVIEALGNESNSIPVSGQDAELAAVRRIINGSQTMTVYKSIHSLAHQSADLAMKVAKEEEVETNTTIENGNGAINSILLEPITVTEDNIRETIIAENHLTEAEVYE